jgi:hypothetical protein
MTHKLTHHGWRLAAVAVLAGSALVGAPMLTGATAQTVPTTATAVGNTFGGMTSQHWPVIIDMSANRRQVNRAVAGLEMPCTDGGTATIPSRLAQIPVTRAGAFHRSFGPVTFRNDDGTTTDFQGRITGRVNAAKTKIAGTWSAQVTDHDATGAVVGSCFSGTVNWTAKQ